MKWRALPCSSKNACCWDDEFVVFNKLSGDTHLLSALAGQILLKLQQGPFDLPSLAKSLSPAMRVGLEQELECQIDDILADLYTLALIERI